MRIPRHLVALALVSLLLGPSTAGFAADDLVAEFVDCSGNGAQHGPGDGGYKIRFDPFDGEPSRALICRTAPQLIDAPSITVSVAGQMTQGAAGDLVLLFGASEQGHYYVGVHQDLVRVRWSVGHFRPGADPPRQFMAGAESDVVRQLSQGNELAVTIVHRDGETPLLIVQINGAQVAELAALHGEDDPLSPFGGVGVMGTAYRNLGETAYFFRDLTVAP
jgi:hypothetical protein